MREELEFGPKNLEFQTEDIDAAVTESVSALNLNGLEEYPPLGLSFGQQKRTTIAAVLAMRSKIMVMDEPTAGQDYANYTHFMDEMCCPTDSANSLLTTKFAATLFITHDLDLAVTYANRVLLVGDGTVVGDGPPEDVLKDFALLERCRVRRTSLLDLNLSLLPKTGGFYRLKYWRLTRNLEFESSYTASGCSATASRTRIFFMIFPVTDAPVQG